MSGPSVYHGKSKRLIEFVMNIEAFTTTFLVLPVGTIEYARYKLISFKGIAVQCVVNLLMLHQMVSS